MLGGAVDDVVLLGSLETFLQPDFCDRATGGSSPRPDASCFCARITTSFIEVRRNELRYWPKESFRFSFTGGGTMLQTSLIAAIKRFCEPCGCHAIAMMLVMFE